MERKNKDDGKEESDMAVCHDSIKIAEFSFDENFKECHRRDPEGYLSELTPAHFNL